MFPLLFIACFVIPNQGAHLSYNPTMILYQNLEFPGNAAEPLDVDNNKQYYSYSAPEDAFADTQNVDEILSSIKENLRVIFIKPPEQAALENATLQLINSVADQRTVIYVLNKQTDLSELANKLQNVKSASNSIPEVHFVKYQTQDDAEHVKQIIQAQYETLPGSTSIINENVAPVLDYASKSPAATNSYLPAYRNN